MGQVFTDYGREAVAVLLGSSVPTLVIDSCAIGDGSGALVVTDTTLISEHTKTVQTGSPDFTTVRKVTFQADFNSLQMSGLTLSEFGWFSSGASSTGSAWFLTNFGSVVFDGTNELQITTAFEVL